MIGIEQRPLRPLPLASARLVEALQNQGLLSGKTERALVQALAEQRERYCQSGGQTPLSLTLAELAQQLGLLCQTNAERQRAIENLQTVIWRLKPKLYLAQWTITSLHTGWGERWALFHVLEVGVC